MRAVIWTASLSLLLTLTLTGCSSRHEIDVNLKGGSDAANSVLCVSMEPVYMSDAEIAALSRPIKEKIGANNLIWEKMCTKK